MAWISSPGFPYRILSNFCRMQGESFFLGSQRLAYLDSFCCGDAYEEVGVAGVGSGVAVSAHERRGEGKCRGGVAVQGNGAEHGVTVLEGHSAGGVCRWGAGRSHGSGKRQQLTGGELGRGRQ